MDLYWYWPFESITFSDTDTTATGSVHLLNPIYRKPPEGCVSVKGMWERFKVLTAKIAELKAAITAGQDNLEAEIKAVQEQVMTGQNNLRAEIKLIQEELKAGQDELRAEVKAWREKEKYLEEKIKGLSMEIEEKIRQFRQEFDKEKDSVL